MSDKLLDIFLTQCFTPEQLARKVRVTKMVLECVYYKLEDTKSDTANRLSECLNVTVVTKEDAEFISTLLEKKYLAEDMLYMQLKEVLIKAKDLPTITITSAIRLEPVQIASIGSWLRTNVSSDIMFRTMTDATFIGGCAISWRGAYKDFSIRNTLEQKRGEMRSIIQSRLVKTQAA
jgi:F0F1-type ATP synthase delta subunit